MARNLELSLSKNCLMWNTEKPFWDVPRQSPMFSFLGCDWYFSLTIEMPQEYEIYFYILELLQKEKKGLSEKVSIAVFIKERDYLLQSNWIEHTTGATEMILINTGKSLCHTGLWTVYCIFSLESPVELHENWNETMCLSKLSELNSTETSIFMKAKLAACAPDDFSSGSKGLSYDLNKLLEQKSYSDVTLKCGDKTFSAHKSILSARSEVFATMFQNQMVKNETGVVDITDVDGDVFNLLLKYVYSGKVSGLTVDRASSLYVAADKYAIQNLKSECAKWMLVNVNVDNCLDFLVLTDSCGDKEFKHRLVTFIAEILDLMDAESWLKFTEEYPKLAITVLQMRAFSNQAKLSL